MTEINLKQNKKYLDGEFIFRYYFIEMGSLRSVRKIVKYLKSASEITGVNPDTDKEFTDMAIWFSMWQWAINNSDKAYEVFNKAMFNEGKHYNRKEWDIFLQRKAYTCFRKNAKRFNNWLKETGQENLIGI